MIVILYGVNKLHISFLARLCVCVSVNILLLKMWLPPVNSSLSRYEALRVSVYIYIMCATYEVILELHVRQCVLTF